MLDFGFRVRLQPQAPSSPVPNAFVSIAKRVSSSIAPNTLSFSVKRVPSLALNAFAYSTKRVNSSPAPNAFASFTFSAKRVRLQLRKGSLPEPNVLVLGGERARLQRQKRSFPTQKQTSQHSRILRKSQAFSSHLTLTRNTALFSRKTIIAFEASPPCPIECVCIMHTV